MKTSVLAGISAVLLSGWCNLAAAQSKPEKTDTTSAYSELGKAPSKYRTKPNPMAREKDAVAAGKVLFEEHCAECHGETALGTKKAPNLRANEVQEAPAGSIFWVLTNGIVRKGMPVWSKLPEPQRWQLVTFIKSLGTVEDGEKKADAKP